MESLGSEEKRVATAPAPETVAPAPIRSQRLHNFTLPGLKWGSQRHLRCSKDANAGTGAYGSNDEAMSSSKKDSDNRQSSRSMSEMTIDSMKDGIEEVRQKLMNDLKTDADKIKNEILKNQVDEEETKQESLPPPGVRPWRNPRTRREECKFPVSAGENAKVFRIYEKRPDSSPPVRNCGGSSGKLLRSNTNTEKFPRLKFSVSLTKKEIEEDFIAMVGRKPPRKPTKRPKAVQKQLDNLFPGRYLTEIKPDLYKVPEAPRNGNGKDRKGKGKSQFSDSDEE